MSEIQIIPVVDRGQRDTFIRLPETLHRGRPGYVIPLRDQERIDLFDEERNPALRHRKRFPVLAVRGGRAVGRVLVFLDPAQETSLGTRALFFGHFEAMDGEVAQALFAWAEDLARREERRELLGPWDLVSQRWGLLMDRHEEPAPILGMWNPPEYLDYFSRGGWATAHRLLAFRVDRRRGDRLPDLRDRARRAVTDRQGIRVRTLDPRRYREDVAALGRISNEGFTGNWGYTPVPPEEVEAMARDLKPILQRKAVLFAETAGGDVIGFLLILPDVNRILARLKGTLWPFGFVKLLWGLPRLRHYRVFGLGILPAWQGRGIGPLLIAEAVANLDHPAAVADIDWVLEDNPRMLAILKRMGLGTVHKTYAIQRRSVTASFPPGGDGR